MEKYFMRCEAVDVRTDTGVCPGLAKTKKGEEYLLTARTPVSQGICSQAFIAIHPMSYALRMTDKMDWEKNDHFDIVCPHGNVTFRISRIKAN